MIPHITIPTRLADNAANLIDHILVHHDYTDTLDRVTSGNLISDNLSNFLLVGNKTEQKFPTCEK